LNLSKSQAKFLESWLQGWNLLQQNLLDEIKYYKHCWNTCGDL
jgi:hypothetical protein